VLGETEVSKLLLEQDFGTMCRSFRAGFLDFNPKLINALDTLGYAFNSTFSANDVLTDFPYLSVKKMLTQHQEQKNKDPSQSIVEELQPIKKVLSRFNMAERTLLYLMLHDARAIDFFKTKVEYFYDEMYDTVANYILAWQNDHQHHEMKVSSITDYIAQQDHEKKDAIVQAVIDIAFEKNVPKLGTDTQLLTDLLKVISEQKLQILTSQRYQQANRPAHRRELAVRRALFASASTSSSTPPFGSQAGRKRGPPRTSIPASGFNA